MFSHKDAYEERSEEYLADKKRKKKLAAAAAADPETGLKDSLLHNADATANRDSDELNKPSTKNATATPTDSSVTDEDDDDDDDDDDEDVLGFRPAIFWLAVITVFIAILSELISDSIVDGAKSMGTLLAHLV